MSAIDYSEILGDVTISLQEAGVTMTLVRAVPGTFDPVRDVVSSGTEVREQFYGVVDEATEDFLATIPTGSWVVGDQVVYGSVPATLEPTPGDAVVITDTLGINQEWRVVTVRKIGPALIPVMFVMQVRR